MDIAPKPAPADTSRQLTWKTFRWACMAAALFWALIYRFGTGGSGLPQFVYVNF